MSEYKENTVGWWLSQLKEPLRSSVLRMVSKYKNDAQLDCFSMVEATKWLYELMLNNASGYATFCNGIYGFFLGNVFRGLGYELQLRNGWELAKQCAHDAADFPPMAAPSPEFRWNDNKVIDFVTWYLKMTKLHDHRFEIENQDILDSFKRGDAPELWHQPEYPFGYTPPPPTELGESEDLTITFPAKKVLFSEDEFKSKINVVAKVNPESAKISMPSNLWPGEEIQITMMSDKSTFEIVNPKEAAVEKAVVGYEPPIPIELPKPIDTIEKKHEIRIQNLEARVMQQQADLDATVETLRKVIDLLDKTMVKVTTLEFINDQKK